MGLPGNGDGDVFAGLGPAPDGVLVFLLQNHVFADDRWGSKFGERDAGKKEKKERKK